MASAILAALAFGAAANADIWLEFGDAGALPATAQVTVGSGSLDAITGVLSDPNDADMFLINISNPAAFTALAFGIEDPELSLFSLTGFGIAHNDDIVATVDRRAHLEGPLVTGLAPGLYLLAITAWNNDPVSLGGRIFPDGIGIAGEIFGPTGPGGGQAISGYSNEGQTFVGSYTISLTGAGFAAPEPATVGGGLFSVAVVGLGFWRHRRRP
jgi:hypothetical protein